MNFCRQTSWRKQPAMQHCHSVHCCDSLDSKTTANPLFATQHLTFFTRIQCSFIINTASLCRIEDHTTRTCFLPSVPSDIFDLKTTFMQDRRSRSKQQLLLFQRKILQIHLSDSFSSHNFGLLDIYKSIHPTRLSSSPFATPDISWLSQLYCMSPVTPWNFSTGRVFWNLTVSVEDSLVY